MMAIHTPKRLNRLKVARHHVTQMGLSLVRLAMWRIASAILSITGLLLKFHLISPVTARNMWTVVDAFERWAQILGGHAIRPGGRDDRQAK